MMSKESLKDYVKMLHMQEEVAYLDGDQNTLHTVGAELDTVVTDEIVEEMKGDL